MATILLLEDDSALQFVMREALSGEGHVVHVASDNDSAMKVLRRTTPDVLLLDW